MFIERRSKRRFPLDSEISFQSAYEPGSHKGNGRLVDMSSKAVAFTAERNLPAGAYVQIVIPWPACLDDRIPIKVTVLGRVMGKRGEVVVVSIGDYEFQTRRA